MEYLKKVIEKITNVKLAQLADSLVFNPLGMTDTRLIRDTKMEESRFAQWHNKEGGLYEIFKRNEATAADNMMTTVEDLSKFSKFIMDGARLSSSLFNEMITPQVTIKSRTAYGLGWQIIPDCCGEESILIHSGVDNGVRARLVVMPDSRKAFMAFTNSDNGQKIVDRLMVREFDRGSYILSQIYLPVLWRIINLLL